MFVSIADESDVEIDTTGTETNSWATSQHFSETEEDVSESGKGNAAPVRDQKDALHSWTRRNTAILASFRQIYTGVYEVRD